MIDVDLKFEPDIAKIIEKVKQSNGGLANNIDNAVKKTALNLNTELKLSNPQKTGHSRRGWMAPVRTSPMEYVIYNRVEYAPEIRYGVKKPSKWVATPKGISITPGKPFIDVVDELQEKWLDEMTKQTLLIIKEIKWHE